MRGAGVAMHLVPAYSPHYFIAMLPGAVLMMLGLVDRGLKYP